MPLTFFKIDRGHLLGSKSSASGASRYISARFTKINMRKPWLAYLVVQLLRKAVDIMRTVFISLLSIALLTSCASLYQQSDDRETTVCGIIKEPLVFWAWNRSAGEAIPSLAARTKNSEAIEYKTSDGRILRGYKVKHAEGVVGRGTLLLAQGNAMLADRLLWSLSSLTDAGIDVFVFDYRGYGQSEGRRRLKAIVRDYKEIYENLLPRGNGKRFLYGISFGGIVVSNVIGSGVEFDRAVIDSSPSRLSNHGCNDNYDPVVNLPIDASKIVVIAGEKDVVVRPVDSLELRAMTEQRGGKSILRANYAHPFQDSTMEKHQDRMKLIQRHLLEETGQ